MGLCPLVLRESLCPVQTRSAVKVAGETLPSVAKVSGRKSHGFKTDEDGSCPFMCFHVLCFVIWRLRETGGMKEWFDQDLESSKQHQTHNLQFLGGSRWITVLRFYGFYRVFFLDWKSSRSFSSLKSTDVRVADVTSFILEDLLAGQTQGFMKACGSSLRK